MAAVIRKMIENDRDSVLAMMQVFYSSDAVATNGSPKIFTADFDACISENPYAEGYVFVLNGEIAGYAMLARSFSTEYGVPCIWIEDLYLKENARNMGLATKFFELLAEQQPHCLLRLEAEQTNAHAVHVYRKNGFEELPYMELIKKQV